MTNPLWCERYRPKRVADVALPADLRKRFQGMVDSGDVPVNLLLVGPPGCGKTSVALAMMNELDCDFLFLNGSLEGNLETLRNKITEFATAVSFRGKRKFVVLDEADGLTHFAQPALRNFLETYSANAGFILTCNWLEKIIEPLRDRCAVVEFKFSPEETKFVKSEVYQGVIKILDAEKIKYEPVVVASVVQKMYPHIRSVINTLQAYSTASRVIDSGVLAKMRETTVESLIGFMRDRDFTSVRKWVGEHAGSYESVYRALYDTCREHVELDSVPQLVIHLGTYQYRAAHVADPEINMAACLAEIMTSVRWRNV